MLFKSRHITVTADHGIATLAFGFGGEPINAIDLAGLRELDAAIQTVSGIPALPVLVVRSAIPGGFCAGFQPEALLSLTNPADRSACSWYGQEVLARLSNLDAVTLALIDGPCLGAGLELALACDYRLCVCRPATRLGFPDRMAFLGGSTRILDLCGQCGVRLLESGETVSGREARRLGLVNVACCERRSRIAFRSLLDRLAASPLKPKRAFDQAGLTAERRTFAAVPSRATLVTSTESLATDTSLPAVIALLGNHPRTESLAASVVLRGGSIVVCGDRAPIFATLSTMAARGFLTPFEENEARARVRVSDTLDGFERAELIFVAENQNPFRLAAVVSPRAVICVIRPTGDNEPDRHSNLSVPFPFPRRVVRAGFCDDNRVALLPETANDPTSLATLVAWLKQFGLVPVVFPVAARLLPRAA
jgi:enoyl-CoA hydratase/carnithine racemase